MRQLLFCPNCSSDSPCVFRALNPHELLPVFSIAKPLSVTRNAILDFEGFPAEDLYAARLADNSWVAKASPEKDSLRRFCAQQRKEDVHAKI